ncbi:MAG: ArsA-related P-loop ATPase [Candidatus Pacearchaeota archaeon]
MKLLDRLRDKEIWVTGKGGTGKTTVSSALAMHYANQKEWVLAFDIDGYHSMPDAFLPETNDFQFKIPENEVYTLYDKFGVDLDLCLVSPSKIIDYIRMNRGKNHENRTRGLPHYFGILHLYDVLEQLGTFVANEDLASLCLICAERNMRLNSPEVRDGRKARFIYDNQSSNATINLLNRASGCVERLKVMQNNKRKWNIGAKAAGWPDMASFVNDGYIKNLQQYIDSFVSLNEVIKDPLRTSYVIVTGTEKREMVETMRLLDELKEKKFPVGAILLNRFHNSHRARLEGFEKDMKGTPVYTIPRLPSLESSENDKRRLLHFVDSIEEY